MTLSDAAPVDPLALRAALGRFATGVAIITCRDADGAPVGLTANSFSALSLDPALVLWSLRIASSSVAAFDAAPHFVVNVLAETQVELSRRFASKQIDKFADGHWLDGLGQSPVRSGSVFNFFRPGSVPPNSVMGTAGLVAPEFQITNESTVVGYVNYLQTVISRGVGDVKGDYSALLPLADTAQTLLDEINVVLVAGQLSAPTVALIKGALDSMPSGTDASRLNRIYAALVMVMAAPEFIVQK